MQKEYLGDGVYVRLGLDGDLILSTEDGISITNTIVLEPEVRQALISYIERFHGQR